MERLVGACVALLSIISLAAAGASCNSAGENAATSPSAAEASDRASTAAGAEPPVGEASEPTPEPEPEAWEDAGYRRVFSLVDNRHLVHTYDTGLFIDLGRPAAYKYVQGRWRTSWQAGTVEDGRAVAYTDGIGANFRFPLTRVEGDLDLVLFMKAVGDGQAMDVFVNSDDALPTLTDLPTTWGEVRVRLPRERLSAGENHVRFYFRRTVETGEHGRTAAAFDWARLEPVGQDPLEADRSGSFGLAEGPDGSPALTAPAYGSLAIYLTVPETARLRLHLAAEGLQEGETRSAFVRLVTDGRDPVELWDGEVGTRPVPVEADLSAYAGQVVRLELGGSGAPTTGRLLFIDPALVVPERPARQLDPEQLPRNVLVWLIDAMRADLMTWYNPDAPVDTPNLTRFAENCVAFRRTSVQGNSSLPSSASMHTSTYPSVHGIVTGNVRIDRDLTVLGEALEADTEHPWDTSLFSSNGYVTQSRGMARGYDDYRNLIHEPGRPDSEYLWPIVRDWIDGRGDTRWFTFINTIDPHVPYDPPEELVRRYHPEPYTGRIRPRATGELLDGLGDRGLSDDDLRYLRALYYGEITYNDIWFGHMIDDLTERGLLDDTLIVITSDHGEGFMEHGRAGHGAGVYEEVTHIPLLFCHPRSLGEARWVETEVESIDLYPTLLDLFGEQIPPTVQGISLVPLMLDPTPAMNRPGVSYQQDYLRGLRIGRWKYLFRGGDNDDLYDLDESALEGEDRRADDPVAYRYMRDVMAFHLAFDETWHKAEWGFANNHSPAFAARLDESVW